MVERILIDNAIVVTVDPQDRIIEHGSILIEDRKIIAVGKHDEVQPGAKPDIVIDGRGKAVIPGLVNLHLHSGLTRGSSDDLPLYEWLRYYVNPIYAALRPEDAYATGLLSYAEALKSGVTCVLDMYRHMGRMADAASEVGIRCFVAPTVSDLDYMDKLEDNIQLIRTRNGDADGRINVWCGFHSWRDCGTELIAKVRETADKYKVGIHTHSNESIHDPQLSRQRYGKEPIEHLRDNRIVGKNVVIAHCCWLTDAEIAILRSTGTHVAHCPISNMKLADGVAPVPRLLREGVNVGLGTDGINETNTFDMFRVMHEAALLHRIHQMDATLMPAKDVLRMATQRGARALGLDAEVGSIEVGKKADLAVMNLKKIELAPLLYGELSNVLSLLTYTASGRNVDTVFVDGRIVVSDGVLQTMDEGDILEKATKHGEELLNRRKEYVDLKIGVE